MDPDAILTPAPSSWYKFPLSLRVFKLGEGIKMKVKIFAWALLSCAPCVASEDTPLAAASNPFARERAAAVQYFRGRINWSMYNVSADQLHEKMTQLLAGLPSLMSCGYLFTGEGFFRGFSTNYDIAAFSKNITVSKKKLPTGPENALKSFQSDPALYRSEITRLSKLESLKPSLLFFGLSSCLNDLVAREATAVAAAGGKDPFIQQNIIFPAVVVLLREAQDLFPADHRFKQIEASLARPKPEARDACLVALVQEAAGHSVAASSGAYSASSYSDVHDVAGAGDVGAAQGHAGTEEGAQSPPPVSAPEMAAPSMESLDMPSVHGARQPEASEDYSLVAEGGPGFCCGCCCCHRKAKRE